ncbi:hypothetical protein [Alloactinosynnema sp. L-07]|nr:hypothetical protein [Alloactinosynnema sp. L-07]
MQVGQHAVAAPDWGARGVDDDSFGIHSGRLASATPPPRAKSHSAG